jgi:hypothetical protein
MNRWWPPRESWTPERAELPDGHKHFGYYQREASRAIQGTAGQRWCNMDAQKVDEWFRVHLGKPRIITGFRMVSHEKGGYPEEYRVEIRQTSEENEPWTDYRVHSGPIDFQFPSPTRIVWIQVKIVKPSLDEQGVPYGWSISDIQVTEQILGRWLHTWKKLGMA